MENNLQPTLKVEPTFYFVYNPNFGNVGMYFKFELYEN